MGPTAGLNGFSAKRESLAPTKDQTPNRPARSEHLYRLRYSGPLLLSTIIFGDTDLRKGYHVPDNAVLQILVKVPSFRFRSLELVHSLSSLADRIIAITVICGVVTSVLLRDQRTGNTHHLLCDAVYKHTSLIEAS